MTFTLGSADAGLLLHDLLVSFLVTRCRNFDVAVGLLFRFDQSCLIDGESIDTYVGFVVLALRDCNQGWSCVRARM